MVVQVHDHGGGGTVRAALAVGQDLRHIEHLQAADHRGDHDIDEDGADEGDGDLPEHLVRGAAVQLGGLIQGGIHAHDGGHQHDGGVAEPHQEVHQADQPAVAPDGVQEAERLLQDAHADQHRIDGAVVREEGKKQHGEGRGHDQVRHVDDCLEEGLALQLQAKVGEPRRQQQGDCDLRDEPDDPEQQGVAEILRQVCCKEGHVILQAHETGSDDLQAAAVIFKEAVINGGCQRDQLKYREDDEERRNEDVAPFRVADRPFLIRFFSHVTAS